MPYRRTRAAPRRASRRRRSYSSRPVTTRYLARSGQNTLKLTLAPTAIGTWSYNRAIGNIANPIRVQSLVYDTNFTHTESGTDESYFVRTGLFKATAAETQLLAATGNIDSSTQAQFQSFDERVFAIESMFRTTSLDLPIQHRVSGRINLDIGEALYFVCWFAAATTVAGLACVHSEHYKYVTRTVDTTGALSNA